MRDCENGDGMRTIVQAGVTEGPVEVVFDSATNDVFRSEVDEAAIANVIAKGEQVGEVVDCWRSESAYQWQRY